MSKKGERWFAPDPGKQTGNPGEYHVYDPYENGDFFLGEKYGITMWIMGPKWLRYATIPERILT